MTDLAAAERPAGDANSTKANVDFASAQIAPGPDPAADGMSGGPEGPRFRLDVPRAGHVVSTHSETYAGALREAVSILADPLSRESRCAARHRSIFGQGQDKSGSPSVRPITDRAARALVAMRTCAVASRSGPTTISVTDAERWFLGPEAQGQGLATLVSKEALARADTVLASNVDATAYRELLPYLLDPEGPGDRLTVRRNPHAKDTRARRRARGIFYTPADIAEAMVETCLKAVDGPEDGSSPTVFDPACGTGVFLRAALKELRRSHPEIPAARIASSALFGTDIDPWAVEAAAFVLVTDAWNEDRPSKGSPVALWREIRRNLVCVDALRIDPGASGERPSAEVEAAYRATGAAEPDKRAQQQRFPLPMLFPALPGGPQVIIGNPPYAVVGERDDYRTLQGVFRTFEQTQQGSAQICLGFLEQMVRVACEERCAGALVLPLSVACNVDRQFSSARRMIGQTAGSWRFAFFDREPHALFGEGVKTRNAIVYWRRTSSDTRARIATGPLRKWRGSSRARMLKSLRFTPINCDIRSGIPKIDGATQAKALKTLSQRWTRLEQAVHGIERALLADVPRADDRTVFVGSTAYNFINVFLTPTRSVAAAGSTLSENPLFAIECASRDDALAVFSILSSRLVYWWWHVHGDGFHVAKRFITSLPFGIETLAEEAGTTLRAIGKELWSKVRTRPIITTNRGRTSVAYTPIGHEGLRREADRRLAEIGGVENSFVDELEKFTTHTVAATLRDVQD